GCGAQKISFSGFFWWVLFKTLFLQQNRPIAARHHRRQSARSGSNSNRSARKLRRPLPMAWWGRIVGALDHNHWIGKAEHVARMAHNHWNRLPPSLEYKATT
ncbi:MAG: hypothetical protein RR222_10055, partial [Pseudomonas sp.]|uniref:hypothetical protein n=1 Tax=Pseudomonas sp. TaxID=306 RepID=UPI002FC70490